MTGCRRHLEWSLQQQVIERIVTCPALPFLQRGKVDLKHPQRIFRVMLVYPADVTVREPTSVYLLEDVRWPKPRGRTAMHRCATDADVSATRVLRRRSLGAWTSQLADGNRAVIDRFALTKRPYLGTTSMNTELAFLMANQALVSRAWHGQRRMLRSRP